MQPPFDIEHEAKACVNEIHYGGHGPIMAAEIIARYMREAVLASQTPGGVLMGRVKTSEES